MPLSEFDLIAKYFTFDGYQKDVQLGIGDDAALISVPAKKMLAVSVDTLVEGVHFFADAPAASVGHKALAVNLSDMAAMGADPAWFTLAITLPAIDHDWLQQFCTGMRDLASRYNVSLVGGDTTRGPLCISVQISGYCTKALQRDRARPGQLIMVSGTLGDAAAAVAAIKEGASPHKDLLQQLQFPEPQINLGKAITKYVDSAIDISDGLVADLGHILNASHCGARIHLDKLPLSEPLAAMNSPAQWQYVLAGGDDYGLCFTLAPSHEQVVMNIANKLGVTLTTIGVIEASQGLRILREDGTEFDFDRSGYDHFA